VHPRTKITIDSLYKVAYEKTTDAKMNDFDLCLEVVQGHVNHCVTSDVECLGNP